jgi:hypothetical protein
MVPYLFADGQSVVENWAGQRQKAAQLTVSAGLIDDRADTMISPVMLILGFCFTAP